MKYKFVYETPDKVKVVEYEPLGADVVEATIYGTRIAKERGWKLKFVSETKY